MVLSWTNKKKKEVRELLSCLNVPNECLSFKRKRGSSKIINGNKEKRKVVPPYIDDIKGLVLQNSYFFWYNYKTRIELQYFSFTGIVILLFKERVVCLVRSGLHWLE